MAASIDGMLSFYKRKNMNGIMNHDDGRPLTDGEARAFLAESKEKGWKVIPCGDCDNFDHQTGCKGHVLMYEDELPDDMSRQDYSAWYDKSSLRDGVRMGPIEINGKNLLTSGQAIDSTKNE